MSIFFCYSLLFKLLIKSQFNELLIIHRFANEARYLNKINELFA